MKIKNKKIKSWSNKLFLVLSFQFFSIVTFANDTGDCYDVRTQPGATETSGGCSGLAPCTGAVITRIVFPDNFLCGDGGTYKNCTYRDGERSVLTYRLLCVPTPIPEWVPQEVQICTEELIDAFGIPAKICRIAVVLVLLRVEYCETTGSGSSDGPGYPVPVRDDSGSQVCQCPSEV
jgi:hypothetical protein